MFILMLPFLTGCGKLDDIKETIEGLTNPLVCEGIFLGVAEPDIDGLDLSDTAFSGAAMTVFLADASNPSDLENSPLDGAVVNVRSASLGQVALNEKGGGNYSLAEDGGLDYFATEDYTLNVSYADDTHKVTVTAPHTADIVIEEQHNPGENLIIDVSNYEFDAVLVAVINITSAELTYTNKPEGIMDIYDFTHADGIKRVEIPGTAFQGQDAFAVGVAGMRLSSEEDLENMNTAVSAFMIGEMKFYPVSTINIP